MIANIFFLYLLLPILALLVALMAYFIAKRNKLLKNKKLIVYVLLAGIILGLPGLMGFMNENFMPYGYLSAGILYLICGYYNIKLIRYFMEELSRENPFYIFLVIQAVVMFIAAAIFSVIFNFCCDLQYGIWGSTCLLFFIFPLLFWETFNRYMSIPPEIYKIWNANYDMDISSFEYMNLNELMVLELQLHKRTDDPAPATIKAKARGEMPFGVWFYKFLTDYNKKFPLSTVEFEDDNSSYGWIFYVKPYFFSSRRYIDGDVSIEENRIKEKYTIICKRVSEKTNIELNK